MVPIMKGFIWSSVGACLIANCFTVFAEPQPRIQFEMPVFNFGKVSSGEVVKHSFVFTNTGSATLEIIDVKPGCGCTTAGAWDKSVEPGKTGSIPLQLNSTGFGGTVTKSATITCNDPASSNVVLQLTGTIWRAIEVTPANASFSFPAEGQSEQTRVLRIVNNLETPLSVEEPITTNKSFRVELKAVKPGKEFELHVTAIPPFTAPFTTALIKAKTSAKEMPEISTSAYASVIPAISVMPQQVVLPAGPLTAEKQSTITIQNNTTNTLALSDATINVPGATVAIKETQPGRLYTLALSFPAGFQADPGVKPEVTVKSTNPKSPVIKVSIFQPRSPVVAKPVVAPK